MPKYKLIVLSEPVDGREKEYDDWYENVHIPQLLGVEGIASAQRFILAENLTDRQAMPYAAIYNIETDDLKALLENMEGLMESGDMTLSDAVDTDTASVLIYRELGPQVKRPAL